jgi:trehalose 6-phosphate phosphatase
LTSPLRALAAQVAAPPGRILLVTDYDGTLAEIDLDPMAARLVPGAARALARLGRIAAARPDRLAVVVLTGRAVADVVGRVRVGGVLYLGNHGIDRGWLPRHGRIGRLVASDGLAGPERPSARLGRLVAAELGQPAWLFVEVKGGSVAFHYRRAPDPQAAFDQIDRAVEAILGADGLELERSDGRLIVELRPLGAGGKGAAVGRLVTEYRPASVLALGDDVSDAEGFRLLAGERAAGRLAALNVGIQDRIATPDEVPAAADVMLDAPREAARLLAALATILAQDPANDPG